MAAAPKGEQNSAYGRCPIFLFWTVFYFSFKCMKERTANAHRLLFNRVLNDFDM